MTRPEATINRFFVSADYSIYYRRANQVTWQNQVSANYGWIFVLKGELECVVNEQSFPLNASHSLIIEPNVNVATLGKQVEFLYLSLAASLVIEHAVAMSLIATQSMITFTGLTIKNDSKLREVSANIISELVGEQAGHKIVMRALAEQALVHLLRNYSTPRRSDGLELSRVGLVDRRIRRSVELMHAQLDQDLSLKSLAAASYLSPFHFSRLFKKLTGATPHNYLAAVRAIRAQSLLADTDLSITQIGARVGYLSASHFTKAFRLSTGTTPREFRKALISR